jgi:multiple sugar transport system substrate-binding protein
VRALLVLLVLTVLLGVPIAAQGSKAAGTNPADKAIVLKWYGAGFQQNNKAEELIARFNKVRPDVTVEYVELGSLLNEEFFSKYDVMIASGEQADVVYMGVLDILKRSLNGAMLPINDQIASHGDDFTVDYGQDWTMLQIDSKIYGVPYSINAFRVFYNKNWLRNAGIEIPENWTLDQFLDITNRLKDPKAGVYGSFLPLTWYDLTYAPAQVAGWTMVKVENGVVKPNFDDPRFRKNMEYLYRMSVVDKSNPDLPTTKAERLNRRLFLAEKKTPIIVDSWYALIWLNTYRYDSATKKEFDFDIGVTEFPRLDETVPEDVNFSSLVGAWAIPKTSKYPDVAYEFARFVANENPDQMLGIPAYKQTKMDDTLVSFTKYVDKGGIEHTGVYPDSLIIDTLTVTDKSHFGYHGFDPLLNAKYSSVLDQLFQQEVELYLIGEKTLDEFIATMQKRGAEEIKRLN